MEIFTMEEEEGSDHHQVHHLDHQMFVLGTGIVLLITVEHITLLAAQAASSVVLSKMTCYLLPLTQLTSFFALEPLLLLVLLPPDPHGNLVIGFAIGNFYV